MSSLKYLTGYPPALLAQVQDLLACDALGAMLSRKYPEAHVVRSDAQLYAYVQDLKERHMRKAPPLGKVLYDGKLKAVQHMLGVNVRASRVQGGRLKTSREIRVASVFREAPAAFLRAIVVHELAHLREPDHDKAFYQLCTHIEPDYHQLEFDLRLWLTQLDIERAAPSAPD